MNLLMEKQWLDASLFNSLEKKGKLRAKLKLLLIKIQDSYMRYC